MFVAPLLSLLAHIVAHDHHAVVSQSAYHGFRDTSACGYLRNTRLRCHSVDNVCERLILHIALRHHHYRHRCVFHLCVASESCHHNLADDYARVFLLILHRSIPCDGLCRCRQTNSYRHQKYIYIFHSLSFLIINTKNCKELLASATDNNRRMHAYLMAVNPDRLLSTPINYLFFKSKKKRRTTQTVATDCDSGKLLTAVDTCFTIKINEKDYRREQCRNKR